MAKITAADVKKLRDMTGSGMMDCKKALAEADGDFDKAIEILRKRGEKVAAKRSDRDAKEGVIIAQVNDEHTQGVIVRLSCETDFVAKGEDFIKFTQDVANLALANMPADIDGLKAIPMEGSLTVGDKVIELVGKINEKIDITDYRTLEAEQVAPYIHMGYRAGVLVGLNKGGDDAFNAGRDVAMQVAAMRPVSLDKDGIDADTVAKEVEIGKELARAEGKPEAILDKIAQGRLNKFFKENTLLAQTFVKDNKKSVAQYLQTVEKDLTAVAFEHVELS
ncbi:MAG: translation elongation factor Ts [Bacteroidota bacterium]